MARSVVLHCVRAFLEGLGEDARLVPLHEAPAGPSQFGCTFCHTPMTRVRIRGVEIDRCEPCDFLLLEPGAVSTIARRVLLSVRASKRRLPLTRNKRLETILKNPAHYGVPW